jgi:hypothetical protein
MSTDGRNLGHVQTLLKEPAYGLVSQIVETQTGHACTAPQALPGKPERVGGDREYRITQPGRRADDLDGAWR